jgi:hypothetical protein
MGSVAASGFSVSNLLQSVSSGSPQLSAVLSSSAVQTALKSASPGDLLKLSSQAVQLQEADQLFADSNTAASAGTAPTIPSALDPLSSLLASLSSTTPGASSSSSSSTGSSTASLANQLAGYQGDLQANEMQALFGVGQTGPPPSTLFDVLG